MAAQMTVVDLGFVVGALPTMAMIIATYILSQVEENERLNAFLSNFSGGIIIAATAGELFPLIMDAPPKASMIGSTVGFAAGAILVLFMDPFIEWIVETIEAFNNGGGGGEEAGVGGGEGGSAHGSWERTKSGDKKKEEEGGGDNENKKISISYPEGYEFEEGDKEGLVVKDEDEEAERGEGGMYQQLQLEMKASGSSGRESPPGGTPKKVIMVEKNIKEDDDWEETEVEQARKALDEPQHKSHILEHMQEICDMIALMERSSKRIVEISSAEKLDAKAQREAENIAEDVDERIHLLQYKVDHCRRLLQGNESMILKGTVKSWLTEEKKRAMSARINNLKSISSHIVEHINGEDVTVELIKELYEHMEDMEKQINRFHESVCEIGKRWVRKGRGVKALPETNIGDKVPVNLVIPVVIDCFVDGFLIGISVALSPKAGFILCAANCLEMSILGMAYSGSVSKCTGSTPNIRMLSLYCPPLVMFLAAGLGAAVGEVSYSIPALFVAFVSFGVVNLLFLSCVELIPDAKEINEKEENGKWWILAPVFFGVWLILMLDHAFD